MSALCVERSRPRLEISDIFRTHASAFRAKHLLTEAQKAALRDIESCRTAALGGHVDRCPKCEYAAISYNSCRNRHCPKCQSLAQDAWIERRKASILSTHYFHVVFTIPSELHPIARRNAKLVYDLLFKVASRTVLQLGADPKRLGGRLGITAVLHTWTRTLLYHPHVHCIVTGGALDPTKTRWIRARHRYLFPVRVLSRLFRGKFLAALSKQRKRGALDLGGQCAPLQDDGVFQDLKRKLFAKEWVVYAKRPFGGPGQVFAYLGRYTHRVGISNQRLESFDDRGVRFRTKCGNTVTVHPEEFIRRFLLHVLPKRFVKIRHFGLMAAHCRDDLSRAREILGDSTPSVAETMTWEERLLLLTGHDPRLCPACRNSQLHRYPLCFEAGTAACSLPDTS